jgi:hypothetical protein
MSRTHAKSARHGANESASELRARIAFEAARLISESGLRDYAQAKRKAAERLGAHDEFSLPKNSEIETALRERQRLFHAQDQPQQLHDLRQTAIEAMRFFSPFEPRLVGAVLQGTADAHSAVCLHLFSDDPDAPARHLDEHGIDCETQTRRLRLGKDDETDFPVLRFAVGDTAIDATIFPYDGLRQAPFDRITGKPMQRANAAALRQMLGEEGLRAEG